MSKKDRAQVIENIARAANAADYYAKVELNDPVLNHEECKSIAYGYLESLSQKSYAAKNFLARCLADFGSWFFHHDLEVLQEVPVQKIQGGMMLTSNHFGPLENLIIRRYVKTKQDRKRLFVISQITNFAMVY